MKTEKAGGARAERHATSVAYFLEMAETGLHTPHGR
jgi:hypothetical protein